MSYNNDQPWGFVVYRTYYDVDELWEETKANLEESQLYQADGMEEEGGNLETATYVYIEDEASTKTSPQPRSACELSAFPQLMG